MGNQAGIIIRNVKNELFHSAKRLILNEVKGIECLPMVKVCEGYVPDYNSRYFTEDFPYGIRYIWKLAHDNDVSCPNIDMVYKWGMSKISNAK